MSQQDFEIRFDQARVRLNSSLKELERAITTKLQTAPNLSNHDSQESETIQNLSNELNKLQTTLAEIGDENENLVAKNKLLMSNLNKLRTQGPSLVEAIESDLIRIEEIIKGEK